MKGLLILAILTAALVYAAGKYIDFVQASQRSVTYQLEGR